MGHFILAVFSAVMLAGCAVNQSYSERAMSLQMGMTKNQVIALMGTPKKVAARNFNGKLVERYSWWSPRVYGFTQIDNEMLSSDRVFVKLADGKVIEWGDSYDLGGVTDRSSEMQNELLKSLQQRNAAASPESK